MLSTILITAITLQGQAVEAARQAVAALRFDVEFGDWELVVPEPIIIEAKP